MKISSRMWLLGFLGCIACGKTTTPNEQSQAETSPSAAPASSGEVPTLTTPTAAPAPAEPSHARATADTASAPASFKGGRKEDIASAVGLGCEARSASGWLEFLCRKKNGTGGHPLRAVIRTPGDETSAKQDNREPGEGEGTSREGEEVLADEHGELRVVVPYSGADKRDVTLEWSDTQYVLHVNGEKAALEWGASGVPLRRSCQALLDESKAVVSAAQKQEGTAKLGAGEAAKLPRFGVCQPAGLGSWALALSALSANGEGAARALHAELGVVHVAMNGEKKSAVFGSFDFAPGGLELGAAQVYDYDDDGRDELIVPYELKARAGNNEPSMPPAIWSFSDAGVSAFAKAPAVSGGIGIEQLDFDMRPDLGGYGPFVAWLAPDCGQKTCKPRLTGPKFYAHSLQDGSFAVADEAAKNALKRACPSKPTSVVVLAGTQLNLDQTAKNLVCARAWGVGKDAILVELKDKHAALCGEAATCGVENALSAWLDPLLPVTLG